MHSLRLVMCALLLAPAVAMAQQAAPATPAQTLKDLSGVWEAKKRFGPDVRGSLIIERRAGSMTADIAGYVVPVSQAGGELDFALPGDRGRFSGRIEESAIRGLWTKPPTPLFDGRGVFPVVLKLAGPERWAGEVDTPQDEFTFYLSLRARADHAYDAALRNPEFDLGNQQNVTRLLRDGDTLRLIGHRGNQDRDIAVGQVHEDPPGFSLVFPSRGGTYDFVRSVETSNFYPRPLNAKPYRYRVPPALADGWPTGTLDQAGIDRRAMEKLVQSIAAMPMDAQDTPEVHALLIARHGKLALEEYFHGFDRERLHNTRSAGKSMTAIAIGAAIHSGAPLKLSSPVYEVMNGGTFPAGLEPRKRAMTLVDLLTMSSGFYCDDTDDNAPGNEEVIYEQTAQPDWLKYTLAVPMATDPGENSVYCSSQPNLALGMLGAATHASPVSTFDRLVARPMQITNYLWGLDPAGQPYGGGGSAFTARDFMKFGQLMLNGGTWNGRRILDANFVSAASSAQYHLRNVLYGYLWWVEDYPYKKRTVRSFSARGAGGQFITVIPELDLVVVVMAGSYSSRTGMKFVGNLVPRSILPAVREKGDDPSAPVKELDWTSPYGPSKDGSRVKGS